jgi:REP element-mobilizing transposase RayT
MVDFPLFLLARRYIVLTGKIAERLRELLRQGCKARGIKIIRGGIGSDHVHMLISCPPTCTMQNNAIFEGKADQMLYTAKNAGKNTVKS